MSQLMLIAGLAIFTAGFLWPVEDAVNGGGLHLVLLWTLLVALSGLVAWREQRDWFRNFRWTLADFGVLLLALGHLLSTVMIFRDHGDRRSALNLCFEWGGLLVQWMLLRNIASVSVNTSRVLTSVVCSIAFGLAAFGIWQSMVFYPQQADWYRSRRQVLDDAHLQTQGVSASQAAQVLEEFQLRGIPLEGTSRILWENRLLSSTEPFATFSLANTLAGILASSLVIMLSVIVSGWAKPAERPSWRRWLLLLPMLVVAWCLVLTKSRSGWVGCLVAVGLLLALRWKADGSRRLIVAGGVAGLTACVLFGLAAMSGVIDKEVILESPRSLQFRLMYWTGSLQMLRHQPVFGPGPGNFRNAYLQYRADESSEEIRDPHNFLLDAWSSAGLAGLLGMMLVIGNVVAKITRARPTVSPEHLPQAGGVRSKAEEVDKLIEHPVRTAVFGVVAGFGIHLSWEWLNGGGFGYDELPQLLLLVGVPFAGLFQQHISLQAFACAGIAMAIHLLAAGGFSMPAVMSLMFLLAAMSVSERTAAGNEKVEVSRTPRPQGSVFQRVVAQPLLWTSVCVVASWCVSQWGMIPVMSSSQAVAIGNVAFQQRDLERAKLEFSKAAESDPLSVAPRQQLADLEAYRLEEIRRSLQQAADGRGTQGGLREEERNRIQSVVRGRWKEIQSVFQALFEADRRSPNALRREAQGLAAAGEILGDQEILKESLSKQQLALRRYPSSLDTCVELVRLSQLVARTSPGVGNSARQLSVETARRALELDSINRSWGHSDRYLDDLTVSFLKDIAGGSGKVE